MMDSDMANQAFQRLLVMRILVIAMTTGCGVLLVIAVVLRAGGQMAAPPDTPIVSYMAVAMALVCTFLSYLIPKVQDANWRKGMAPTFGATGSSGSPAPTADAAMSWWPYFQTRLIIRCALLEGPALFQFIAYIMEGQIGSLAIGVALMIGLLAQFPTQAAVERWIEVLRQLVEEGR
jgi:hypothetical protein